ncbi:MAG: DNA alkylation repair protein [Tissierellia bacterium]|nr:DNA alkylation repair protein [Tissierellia bacterium]
MDKYLMIKEKFESQKNEEQAIPMAKYLRNKFKCYGLKTQERRNVYKDVIQEDKARGIIDWEFLYLCFQDEYRDMNYLVLDYLLAQKKSLQFDDIKKMEFFVKTNQWWDSIDVMNTIIGDIGLLDPRVDELMLKWSTDKDFWLRRVAITHQLMRKINTNTELLEKILVNTFGSDEFFINKAIGWALRDYSKTNPDWVRNFIGNHWEKMSKLSIREGSKYI